MACQNCGTPGGGTPVVPTPVTTTPVCGGATALSCTPMQQLPPPLPLNIPATNILANPIAKCDNGNSVPPKDQCDTTLDGLLTDMQQYLHCVLSAHEISKHNGDCSILRVKDGKVIPQGFSAVFNDCMGCVEPAKICPGKEGEVLTTIAGKPVWAPAAAGGGPKLDCASLSPLLEMDSCIESGTAPKYFVGYSSVGGDLQYFPYSSAGFISNCADLKARVGDCFVKVSGTPTHMLAIGADGKPDYYPVPVPTTGGPAPTQFIADCAGLKDKLGTCITEGTATPTKVLAKGANGIEWLNPPAATGGGGPQFIPDCATFQQKLFDCVPLASPAKEATHVYAVGKDNKPERYLMIDPYHLEVRGANATTNGVASTQALLNVFGDQTGGLQDIVGLWKTVGESGQAGASWFDQGTGKVTIKRKGRYLVNWSIFTRTVMGGGASLLASVYAGLTVKRAAQNYNGGDYRAEAAIYRGNQQQMFGNALQWDFVLGGAVTLVLEPGDQLWVRVVAAKTSPNITITSFIARDDGASHFHVSQLDDKLFEMPGPA